MEAVRKRGSLPVGSQQTRLQKKWSLSMAGMYPLSLVGPRLPDPGCAGISLGVSTATKQHQSSLRG